MKLAFGYKMRSGKDTCVNYLLDKYGGKKITFAKYLYNALHSVQNIFKLPIEKDREFLQIVGDWGRNKDENIFVNLALSECDDNDPNTNYFCNDLRFLNEFKALKSNGWTCIKIVREITTEKSSHISEIDLESLKDDEWNYIIDNNGTLEELYTKIDTIVDKIK